MTEKYDVLIKVISQKGTCNSGHKVGREWVFNGKTPEGMCSSAFNAMLPELWTLMFGGTFPWSTDPDVTTIACPDPNNPQVIELRRLRK